MVQKIAAIVRPSFFNWSSPAESLCPRRDGRYKAMTSPPSSDRTNRTSTFDKSSVATTVMPSSSLDLMLAPEVGILLRLSNHSIQRKHANIRLD